jgi:hypothetical protein
MTRLLWASARIIRRSVQTLEDADTFSEVCGGLNKMTFTKILAPRHLSDYKSDAVTPFD